MSTKKVFDLAVKTGEYQDGDDTKGRYKNVGVVLEGDNGMFIMLDRTFNPAGVPDLNDDRRDTILISMFEPREEEGGSKRNEKKPTNSRGSNSRGNARGSK